MKIAVVGAGIMGRTLTWFLSKNKLKVSLFEKNSLNQKNCSYGAAGMLSPFSETTASQFSIASLGLLAIKIWQEEIPFINNKIFFKKNGTLCVAHAENFVLLSHFKEALDLKKLNGFYKTIKVNVLESELATNLGEGIFFREEAQLSANMVMDALIKKILEKNIYFDTYIKNVSTLNNFDWRIDYRGLGAKEDLRNLRGVRGELIHIHAPQVRIKHMIRILHPKNYFYILPKPNNQYIVGASHIESEDMGPFSVRTALELLTYAYSIHSGFAEGRILQTFVHCRPAFETNLPRIYVDSDKKIICINGLYRYGFLFAPVFAKAVLHFLMTGEWKEIVAPFVFCHSSAS